MSRILNNHSVLESDESLNFKPASDMESKSIDDAPDERAATNTMPRRTLNSQCVKTTQHKCQCPNGDEIDVIIDGYSVKIGEKVFSGEEIQRLKTLNSANLETTYDIFLELDTDVKSCSLEYRVDFLDIEDGRNITGTFKDN